MSEQTILIVDASTGEQTVRPMTELEIAEIQMAEAEAIQAKSESEAKTAARETALAKLAALGLTQEEIEAL